MPNSSPAEAAALVVSVEGLHKRHGSRPALTGLEFSVRAGEIFGLIGPDGAGKTSTFHILAGVSEPSGGRVRVLGLAPRAARERVGYLTQQFSQYPDLSVEENLRYMAGLRLVSPEHWRQRRGPLLRRLGLEPFADRLASQLSGGMKQKLALCCALIDRPQLLLLDEPTTGVDPVSRRDFWDVLTTLAEEGVTIVVATPDLVEAERCHRIALMQQGRLESLGSPAELKQELALSRLELQGAAPAAAEPLLCGGAIVDVQTFGDRLDVLVNDAVAGEAQVRELFRRQGLPLLELRHSDPTLENVVVIRQRRQAGELPLLPFPHPAGCRHQRTDLAIDARQLSRRFGAFEAVRQLTLQIRYGEIFGLLGANGAGKTTTIKMLCGLLAPSSGAIVLAGESERLRGPDLLRRIGYMSQKFTLYDDLSIRENLEFYAGVYGIPASLRQARIDWVVASCGLQGQEQLLTAQLPGGWKQRVAFGAAVLHDPEVLFLDEPTSGVDPLARRQFWSLINDFARRGTAILVTTHYLEEAEQCNRLCFMVAGENVIEGSPGAIKAAQPGQVIELLLPPEQLQAATLLLRRHWAAWRVSRFGDRLHLVLDHPEREIDGLRPLLAQAQLSLEGLRRVPPSLEDAFIGTVQRAQARQGERP
ncbi:ATP-binding cassette domain-containing protein [Synechococcus sp. CS-1329]|uniref:ATP-binding cassette domain-containing protein n=1 Tax=Synechococcus sp. CS-1329 TaxID=2847975 RepID=UPI00223BB5B8|nr:ATP-binding cassette domain-containing protein [Synechococcus sp. CS-1329]MCT0217517.1 ATP-binding cassette domain-containing protein [Synechococcus sp. CS-1329]